MNSFMNIQIRVLSAQALAKLKAVEAQMAGLQAQTMRANAAAKSLGYGFPFLSKVGNQVQWAGRQLQYNFTLPIVLAGAAATKFALDNERAMTRVKKVYGDNSEVFNRLAQTELPALEKAFEALSNKFGQSRAAVTDIAADWAAAGASGVALAKSVQLTLETMILGEIQAKEATEALIAIQAQYGESITDLSRTIDTLNMIENQTGISMQGLIQGFARAAGAARSAGIDVQHLGAMLAAMVPAAGNAERAGNALKTIISRVMAPTKEAAEVMGLMGINVKELSWQSLNGVQRIEAMAKSFVGLDSAQRAVVSSVIASRWQINRFDVLMRDITNTNGYYQRSLQSTADATRNYQQRVKELNAVLDSNPQKMKQIWSIMQNGMANAIQPLLPVILGLAGSLARLAQSFSQLDPFWQKFIAFSLLALAAIGPVVRYIGSVMVLLRIITGVLHFAGASLLGFGQNVITGLVFPFKIAGKGIQAASSGITKAASAVMARMAIIVGNWGAIISWSMMAPWKLFSRTVGGIAAQGLSAMRALLIGGFTLMGRNIALIWSGTWKLIGAQMAAGMKVMQATMLIFSRNMTLMFSMLGTNLIAMMKAMGVIMLTFSKRILGATALLIPGLIAVFKNAGTVMMLGAKGLGKQILLLGPMILKGLKQIIPLTVRLLTSWWGIAIAAVIGILYHFRDNLAQFWKNIQSGAIGWLKPVADVWAKFTKFLSDMFWKLPASVRDAIMTVVTIIATAAKKVYEWFSYLNPFAKHSPSLVDQVIAGMAIIRSEYASVGNAGSSFSKAASDLARFKKAVSGLGVTPFMDERSSVAAVFPQMLGMFDTLVADLKGLNAELAKQAVLVERQQAVVDKWKVALDQANAAVDGESAKLDTLQKQLDLLTDAYDAHSQAMEDYASAPIKGMGEMSDAIFANEMAQKRLRLEMLKWEQVNGSIQDVQNSMALLAGDIEKLKGEAASLQRSGAGSDILGPINDQISQMQDAYAAMSDQVSSSPINEMQKELDKLQQQGDILDLENAINFDPMLREIDKLAHAQKELSYDDIVKGIKAEKAAMAELQPQIDAATAAVQSQQAAVDAVTAARDSLQASYDAEYQKLSTLQDQYRATETMIREIESALRDLASAADQSAASAANAGRAAQNALSPGAENFLNAEGANFPEVGGANQIGREGLLTDQSGLIDQFTKDIQDQISASFGDMDLFGPIKEKWNQFTQWLQDNVWSKLGPVWESVKTGFSDMWTAISNSSFGQGVSDAWNGVVGAISGAWEFLQGLWDLFKDDFKHIIDVIVQKAKEIWEKIGPKLEEFGPVLAKFKELWDKLWPVIKVVAGIVGGILVAAFKLITSVLAHVLGPVLDIVIALIGGVIDILRNVIDFIVSIFIGDWEGAWNAVLNLFKDLWEAIVGILKGAWDTVWGLIEGLINGIIDIWNWLYDVLVGHSIIPDMVNAIIDWFKSLPGKAWNALIALKDKVVDVAVKAWDSFTESSSKKWDTFISWAKDRPKITWENLIALKDKLIDVAVQAWQSFRTSSNKKWDEFIAWAKALPQNLWDNLISLKDKLWNLAKVAFQALKDQAKEMIEGPGGFLGYISRLPDKIAGLLSSVGTKVANGIKSAWNAAADWINNNGIVNINKVTTHFGFTLGKLPKFASGGVIPGQESKKDNMLILARSGEGVIVPELVKHLGGAQGLARANQAAKTGNARALGALGIPGYEDGGIVGAIKGWIQHGTGWALSHAINAISSAVKLVIPGEPFAEKWMVGAMNDWSAKAKAWGDQQSDLGNDALPGRGYQFQIAALHNQFPNAVVTSSFRPGAITWAGTQSMHGAGRAIDIAPRKDVFEWIRRVYGQRTQELFWSPEDGRNIRFGKDWKMDPTTKAGHWDHIHWGYDKGGILPPGLTFATNNTGKNEVTLTAEQWASLSSVVSLMDSITQKSTVGVPSGAAAVARVGARLASVESRLGSTSTYPQRSGGDTFNFYGDLEFPNITDGSDAEDFINNLKGLVG